MIIGPAHSAAPASPDDPRRDSPERQLVGSTFVSIADRGFRASDSLLELWLRLLALLVEAPPGPGIVASTIRDQWLLASRGDFNGSVPDGLDAAVSTPEGTPIIRAAVRSLLLALASAPEHLGPEILNLLGFDGAHFTRAIETSHLVVFGQVSLNLIEGEATTIAAN